MACSRSPSPFVGTPAAVALVAWLVLSVEYSAPPLRFKTTPSLDSLSNGLYVLPAVVGYAALAREYPPAAAVAGGWLWTMGMHTFSAVPDVEPDRTTVRLPVVIAAVLAMDLVLDPGAVALTFWSYDAGGLHYGVPLSNYLG